MERWLPVVSIKEVCMEAVGLVIEELRDWTGITRLETGKHISSQWTG